jgi:hypothetical protein
MYFNLVLSSVTDKELLLLLEQITVGSSLNVFDEVKVKLYSHESMNMDMWNNKELHCGSTTITMHSDLYKLLSKKFTIPMLDIQIAVESAGNSNGNPTGQVRWWKD